MLSKSLLIYLLLFLFVPACTSVQTPSVPASDIKAEKEKQSIMAFDLMKKRQARLYNISWPIFEAGVDLCREKERGFVYGFATQDKHSYGPDFKDTAEAVIGDNVIVDYVHPSYNAKTAGLQPGDIILKVDGWSTKNKYSWQIMGKISSRKETLSIEVKRKVRIFNLNVKGVPACQYGISVVSNDAVNAFATGRDVFITSGLMRFVRSDNELAIIIGHEMSHNALGHLDQAAGKLTIGAAMDVMVGMTVGIISDFFTRSSQRVFNKKLEAEADYVGLYAAARAGYDISGTADFWRIMAAEHPSAINDNFLSSHPSSPERFLAIEETVKEIMDKQSRGVELVPNKGGSDDQGGS